MDWQKYLPIGIIAIVILYALRKMQGGQTQVINRGIDFTQNRSAALNRDPYRTTAFGQLATVALGQQNITSRKDVALAQIEAEKIRAKSAIDLALAGQSNALQMQRDKLASQERQLDIVGRSQGYDRAQQNAALQSILNSQAAAQRRQQTGNILQSILGALGALANRKSSGSSSGGTSSPSTRTTAPRRYPSIPIPNIGPFTPPFNPSDRSVLSDSNWDFANIFGNPSDFFIPEFPIDWNWGNASSGGSGELTGIFYDAYDDPYAGYFDYDPWGGYNPGQFGFDAYDWGSIYSPLDDLYNDVPPAPWEL